MQQSATGPAAAGGSRTEVFSWAMYDWAQSAYSTLQITILMLYITQVVFPGPEGVIAYGYPISATMLLAAFLSPVLGAAADARANKRFWLAATTLPAAGAALAMCFLPAQNGWAFLGLYLITNLGYELSQSFYNGFLPEISTDETINWVSSWGFALGYIGGGLALLVAIGIMMAGGQLGLPDAPALTADYHQCRRGEFQVEVPTGTYDVTVTSGDAAAARDRMLLSVNGRTWPEVNTRRGEFATRAGTLDVTDGVLRLSIEDQGGATPQAVVNALELHSREHPLHMTFDFGTAGSSAAPGSVWVLPKDGYAARDLAADQRRKSVEGETGWPSDVPQNMRFGWSRGEISAEDAVIPLRLRIGLGIMGAWWGLFSLPAILFLRDRGQAVVPRLSWTEQSVSSLKHVGRTLRNVRRYRTLFIFLLAFLLFSDGIQTVISQAGVFASKVLSIGQAELIAVVLMIQFVAMPGAMLVGWLASRIGEKRTLVLCLAIWIVWLCAAFFITTRGQFWAMGVVLSLVMGGTQSVSRAIMGLLTPAQRSAEFFGFFNLSAKAVSMLGPILFASILRWSNNPSLAIISLLVFFIPGLALVLWIDVDRGQAEAAAS